MDRKPMRGSEPHDGGRNDDDLALLARITAGDRNAFRTLYAQYYQPLLRFLYRLTGQFELAQEAINDVMLVVWQRSGSFGGKSKVSTWIMGIAYNKGLKLARKTSRWHARFATSDRTDWGEPFAAAEERTSRADLRDALEQGIRQLPPKHRAVVELTYHYGYSYEEIAAICDCPVNTVKTRMFHARTKLKALLPALTGSEPPDAVAD